MMFYILLRGQRQTSVNPCQHLLRIDAGIYHVPIPCLAFTQDGLWPSRDCFSQTRSVHWPVLSFIDEMFNVSDSARPPGYHCEWFFGCILHRICLMCFCQNQLSEFGRNGGNKKLWNDFVVYSQSILVLCKLFFASQYVFQLPVFLSLILSWISLLVHVSFWLQRGQQIFLTALDAAFTEAHFVSLRTVFFRIHSAQSICMVYLLSCGLLQLYVKADENYYPYCNSNW